MNTRFHNLSLLLAISLALAGARTLHAQDCPEPAVSLLTRNASGSFTKGFYPQHTPDPNNPSLKTRYFKTRKTTAAASGFKTSVTLNGGTTTESNEGAWEDGYDEQFSVATWLGTVSYRGTMYYEEQSGAASNSTPARLICQGDRVSANEWQIDRTEISAGPPATTNSMVIFGFEDDMGPWAIGNPCNISEAESISPTYYLKTRTSHCTNGGSVIVYEERHSITPEEDLWTFSTTKTTTIPDASGPVNEAYYHTNRVQLLDEFTTEELVERTHAMAAAFGNWIGGQNGATYQLDDTEVTCDISRMQYKFAVPNSDPDKHYIVEWDEVTRSSTSLATCPDPLSLPSRTQKRIERIRGTGGDTEGQIHEAQLPLSEGITTVESITVAEVPASDDGANGGAPGGGGFGSGGGGGVGRGCTTCRAGSDGKGGGAPGGNYFGGHFFSISLGYGGNGENLGSILLTPPLPLSAGHTHATNYNVSSRMVGYSMRSDNHPYVTVVRDPQYRIYSIVTPQGQIGITNISETEFTITISPIQGAGGGEVIVWRVFNPLADSSRIWIYKEVNQQVMCGYKYEFTGESGVYPAAYSWHKDNRARWTLTVGTLRQEEVILENFGTNSERHEVTIVRDPALIFPNIVFTAERLIKRFSWGEAVTKITIGSNWVTQFQYAADASFGLSWIGAGSRKPLLRTLWPDGSWEVYGAYDTEGRPTRKFESAGDLEPPDPAAEPNFYVGEAVQDALRLTCRTLDYTYGLQGPFANLAATVEEQLYGKTVRKRTRSVVQEQGTGDYLCTETDFAGPSSTEQTTYRARGGRIVRVDHADGTATLLSVGPPVSTVIHGRTNAANSLIEDGMKTEVWYNYAGQEIARTNFDLASGAVLASATWSSFDGYLRPQRVDYLGGDFATRNFACCGIEAATDREGVTSYFGYDCLGRRTSSTRLGIVTTTAFDPMNNVRSVVVTGGTNTPVTAWSGSYDIAGLLYQEQNAVDSSPSFHDWTYTNGCLFSTNTFPNGGEQITAYYREGSVKRVTGSGVAPMRYTNGVADLELDPGYTQSYAWTEERKLTSTGADTTEWTRSYFDWRGRPVQIVQGDTPANAITRLRYNNKGQLWKQTDPDGVTTLFVYNEKGELARSALAIDGGDSPSLAGRDRVQETLSSVTDAHATKVHRTETKVWTRENDPVPTTAAVVETAVDGKRRWVTSFGRTTTTEVSSLISGVRTVTTTYPDNSQLLRTYASGRLTSALRRTAAAGTIIKSLTYGYDDLGRLSTITDARDGITTITQDLTNRSVIITTPAPGAGQAPQTNVHTFGPMGLLLSTRLPDNSETQTEYYLTGLPKKTYGSHTYPVDYAFDAQGRLQTMVTWQDYAGTTGQATNTLNYNQRGFLQSRTFHGGAAGPSYTYTPGGRLKTRTSARNIVTTYSYGFENAATYGLSDDLVQISYANDPAATPAVNLTYDRVGRLKTGGLAGGMASTLLYSDADGLLSETFSGGALNGMVVTNVFDALGRRATNGVFYGGQWQAQSAYTYDSASRLATASLPLANVSATYSRDIANSPLLSALTFREGSATRLTVTPSYDLLDRLTSVQSAPAGAGETLITAAYAYDLLNQRTGLTNADNSFWVFGYDSKGQVQSGKRYWSDQTSVAGQQFEYQFDDIGNRKQMKSGGDAQGQNLRTTSYTLKPNRLNQYDTRSLPGFVEMMGEATNTASVNVNGQMAGRKGSYYRVEMALTNTSAAAWLGITNVAVLNQGTNPDIIATNIGSLFVPGSPESFTYDADGNLTGDGRWSYTWDAENRLVKMESLASAPAGSKRRLTFEYDWRWRRVRLGASTWANNAWSVTVSNKFAYDGWNLLAEFNATNSAVIRSYLWGNDLSGTMRGAGGAGGLLAVHDRVTINGQPTTHFTCFDGNGNVIGLVNAADGKVSARYEYGPFGELLRATGPMAKANPFRFSTKYQDDETGFLYYGFRYYRADLGRWLNQDPIGEAGGLNLYGFVGNVPTIFTDILGLDLKDWSRQDGPCEPCITCHGVSASGFNGNPNSFSDYLPSNGPNARFGYHKLATIPEVPGRAMEVVLGASLLAAPELSCTTKVGGCMLVADGLDGLQAWFTGTSGFQTVCLEIGLNEEQSKRASLVKDLSMTALSLGACLKAPPQCGTPKSISPKCCLKPKVEGVPEQAKATQRALPTQAELDKVYPRKTPWRKGVDREVFESARRDDGKVYDCYTGKEIKFDEYWEFGHNADCKFSDWQKRAWVEEWSRKDWNDFLNDSCRYQPQTRFTNGGHFAEDRYP